MDEGPRKDYHGMETLVHAMYGMVHAMEPLGTCHVLQLCHTTPCHVLHFKATSTTIIVAL